MEYQNSGHLRRAFDLCNGLGFFFSMATVMVSAAGAIPTRKGRIFGWHKRFYWTVAVASSLLAISVACVVAAFAMGGMQLQHSNILMISGIVIVALPLLWFLKQAEALAPIITSSPLLLASVLFTAISWPLLLLICTVLLCPVLLRAKLASCFHARKCRDSSRPGRGV